MILSLYEEKENPENIIGVDFQAKKVIKKGLAKGTLYKTYFVRGDQPEFRSWTTRTVLKNCYNAIKNIT